MSESAHDRALARVSRAAVRTLTRPSTFRRLVTGHEVRREQYWRVAYQVERRRVVPQFAPAHGVRKHELRPLPHQGAVDPWAVDPVTLPAYSRTASMCPGCQGETKVACATCRGTARVGCGQCGGSGRVAGQRGMKNCPGCRGQGAARCPSCSKGRVSCPMCAATGMVTAWLEISTERLLQVHAHPRDGIAALHADLMSPDDLDAPAASFRSARVQDSGWIAASAPAVNELRAALDPVADRIVAQRTQRFESEVHEFRYGLRSATGVVKVAGSPAGVLPSSDWAPLQLRLAVAVGTAVVGLVLAMVVRGRYVAQAPWFTEHGNALALLVLAGTAACAAALVVSGVWLPVRARSQVRTLVPAGVLAVSSSLALALWFVGGPTVAGVDASIERGDLVEARAEAEALTRLGRDPEGLDVALVRLDELEVEERRIREAQEDDEHFARVQDAPSLQAAVDELGRGWHTDRRVADARGVVVVRAGEVLDASLGADDEAALQAVAEAIAPVDDGLAERARSRGVVARASTCRRSGGFECAVAALRGWEGVAGDGEARRRYDEVRAAVVADLGAAVGKADLEGGDLEARVGAIRRALADAVLYESLVGEPGERSAAMLRGLLTAAEAGLAREQAKREAAARKLEVAAERKRVAGEKRAAAAERRWRKAAVAEPVERGCCKYCSKGKACGDSCIARKKTCHQGVGCAC